MLRWICNECLHEEDVGRDYQLGDAEPCVYCPTGTATVRTCSCVGYCDPDCMAHEKVRAEQSA